MVIRAVLFDLYRTIIDITTDEHDPVVYETLARYLAYHAVKIAPGELKAAYFAGVKKCQEESGEQHPEVDVYRIFSDLMHRYGRYGQYGKSRYAKSTIVDTAVLFRALTIRNFGLYDGCYDTLHDLTKRYRTALVSDAQWVFTEPEMAMCGLDRLFGAVLLSSRLGFRKPDARLFTAALERLGVPPGEAVYIGDNPSRDLVGAKRAGMRCLLFRPESMRYDGIEADGGFDHYHELAAALKGLEEERAQ